MPKPIEETDTEKLAKLEAKLDGLLQQLDEEEELDNKDDSQSTKSEDEIEKAKKKIEKAKDEIPAMSESTAAALAEKLDKVVEILATKVEERRAKRRLWRTK